MLDVNFGAALVPTRRARTARLSSPLERVGEPEGVARTVLYPAPDAEVFTTGWILRPNGAAAAPWGRSPAK
ncbi:hypothetical protein ACIF80_24335 [Streptomyces sp. NPDC085927]|uniref:hypothetical protein n=1 Tax=Streptomyces sp. NPDC085927 TaxID=3365738 RepID=UPI0037D96529